MCCSYTHCQSVRLRATFPKCLIMFTSLYIMNVWCEIFRNASTIEKNRWMKMKDWWITGEKEKKIGTSSCKIHQAWFKRKASVCVAESRTIGQCMKLPGKAVLFFMQICYSFSCWSTCTTYLRPLWLWWATWRDLLNWTEFVVCLFLLPVLASAMGCPLVWVSWVSSSHTVFPLLSAKDVECVEVYSLSALAPLTLN